MTSSLPLVSVLMTAFNREKYIAEAIESVLNQTYSNWELIVVDDGSTDHTVEIAESYVVLDYRVRLIRNPVNLGDYPNRNHAASFAQGEFIMYVDSDDSISSEAIAYLVDAFNRFPSANHSTIYYDGDINEPMHVPSSWAINMHLFHNNCLRTGPGARAFRRSFFESIGKFPTAYGPANDMFFNIKSTSLSSILLIPYVYLNYREHDGQENKNYRAYLHFNYRYFQDVMDLDCLPLSISERIRLKDKSKRRFVLNLVNYVWSRKAFGDFYPIVKMAKFKWSDFFFAVFTR